MRADPPLDQLPGQTSTTPAFPLSAVVGMDDLRTALLLNAVAPDVGGVLVRGEKGTAKSTMVRALASVELAHPVGSAWEYDEGSSGQSNWGWRGMVSVSRPCASSRACDR